ncbi:hypothetical protein BDA96_03G389900 [Sorghum bicolor]|uniref:Uncharacterized protein n=2 Tax=Sorghum bicolor TaxID=4558 RepID=A0A921RIW5_SORBI|nr:hypothetical protein BDA96_03G389900 [Sorghum bicolor]KXG33723.1 hypothetical protein SORBI_3003G361600 [Sorghum bicolor]
MFLSRDGFGSSTSTVILIAKFTNNSCCYLFLLLHIGNLMTSVCLSECINIVWVYGMNINTFVCISS